MPLYRIRRIGKNGLFALLWVLFLCMPVCEPQAAALTGEPGTTEEQYSPTPVEQHNFQATVPISAIDEFLFEEPYPQAVPQPPVEKTEPEPGDCVEQQPEPAKALPQIAIIIDDMGLQPEIGDKLLALDLNLTFSFLPQAPHTTKLENKAFELGREILLHQPMEARDPKWNPGPGAIYCNTEGSRIKETIANNLLLVPHAVGVNNHMGSRLTENRQAIHHALSVVKDKKLFFIDSYTSAHSLAMEEARLMGIPTARRHVFLDNVHTEEDVCRQLQLLLSIAKKQGSAIGIGHPNEATLAALTKCRNLLQEQVTLVPASQLIH